MRTAVFGAVVFALLLQTKPNFSGTWTWDAASAAGSSAPGRVVVVVITQTENSFTLKNGDRTLSTTLDGAESAIQVPGPAGPQDLRIRARWEGRQLIVEQRTATTSITQTVSLSEDGGELTVETVAQSPQGEQRGRQVFKKS